MALLPPSKAYLPPPRLAKGAHLDMYDSARMCLHMYPHSMPICTAMRTPITMRMPIHMPIQSPIRFKCVCACQTCSAELMLETCIKYRAYMAHHHTICCLGIPLILCCR